MLHFVLGSFPKFIHFVIIVAFDFCRRRSESPEGDDACKESNVNGSNEDYKGSSGRIGRKSFFLKFVFFYLVYIFIYIYLLSIDKY